MRKVFLGIMATVIVLSVGATPAFARGGSGHGRYSRVTSMNEVCDNAGSKGNYVDADGNGVCDNAGGNCGYVDADGDGTCDVCGANHRSCVNEKGTNFVDADGDSICDNCGVYHQCNMNENGSGESFTDADNNGVCDNYTASGHGRGSGHGRSNRGGCGR